jgi:hypothetical protein
VRELQTTNTDSGLSEHFIREIGADEEESAADKLMERLK